MPLLPHLSSEDAYAAIYRDTNAWLPAMRAIAQRHGLPATELEHAPPGTHVVFRAGADRLIKLFAFPWRRDVVPERLVLQRLGGHPDILAPRLIAEGELEGWPYLIITAVNGMPLCEVWNEVGAPDRERIVVQLGELMAALHRVPTDGMDEIAVEWPAFLEARQNGSVAQQAEAGADACWLAQVRAYLDDLPALYEPGFRPVLLSADITDEHVMLARRGGHWRLTGLIDFGDAMVGYPLYEFVATTCITRRSIHLRQLLFLAYGFAEQELDAGLTRKLTAYALLHRFASIPDYLSLAGAPVPKDMADLQAALWSVED